MSALPHFMPPIRKPHRSLLGGDFYVYDPDPAAAKEEQPGAPWNGPELPFIMSNSHVPMEPLNRSLERLLENIWKDGKLNKAAPQQFLAGQQRLPQQPMVMGRQRLPRVASIPEPAYQKIPALINPIDATTPHLKDVARDWAGMLDIKRVVAYCFRGDSRDHNQIKNAGGFLPPATRNDKAYLEGAVFEQFAGYMERRFHVKLDKALYLQAVNKSMDANARNLFLEYSTWRALVATEELHLGRMLASEALKGYISTSRAVTTAKNFATRFGHTSGYVYCLLVRGGYLVPPKGKIEWTKFFAEQEVAYPGPIPYRDIVGWRQVQQDGLFTGPIHMRPDLYTNDPQAAEEILLLLSGKKQG